MRPICTEMWPIVQWNAVELFGRGPISSHIWLIGRKSTRKGSPITPPKELFFIFVSLYPIYSNILFDDICLMTPLIKSLSKRIRARVPLPGLIFNLSHWFMIYRATHRPKPSAPPKERDPCLALQQPKSGARVLWTTYEDLHLLCGAPDLLQTAQIFFKTAKIAHFSSKKA